MSGRRIRARRQASTSDATLSNFKRSSPTLIRGTSSRPKIIENILGTNEERDITTDVRGSISIPFLASGNYDLTVRATRFEPFTFNYVQVRITEVSRLKIQLTISGAKNKSRLAPSLLSFKLRTLRSYESSIETVQELPLVNRNFTRILGLTAGTNTDIVGATQLGSGSQEIRANGARSGDNNFMDAGEQQ